MRQEEEEDDILDNVTNLGSVAFDKGFNEGKINGKRAALFEGFRMGQMSALRFSSEMAHYLTVCELYLNRFLSESLILNNKINTTSPTTDNNNETKVDRIARTIVTTVYNIIDKIHIQDDDFVQQVDAVRDKFKTFAALTKIKNFNDATTATPKKTKSSIDF
jgi:flagellar biosynthesis/type III secretory pathway protein FliH